MSGEMGPVQNAITREELSPLERGVSILGVVTGGVFSGVKNLPRAIQRVGNVLKKSQWGGRGGEAAAKAVRGAEEIFDSAKKWGVPAEDLKRVANQSNHVFGPKSLNKHKLGDFLVKFKGDQIDAFKALEHAAQTKANSGALSGVFETIVKVKDTSVTVRGRVVDGIVKLSTAFIP
ncbi:MAG: hypothetical protein ACOH5I_15775 [Oligoflexus sp.]